MEDKNPRKMSPLWQYAGIGVDLAAAVGGFTLIGYLADRYWQTSPRWTIVGAVLGMVGGMYNLIRRGLAASKAMGPYRRSGDIRERRDTKSKP